MRCPEHIRRLFEQPEHAGHLPATGTGQGVAQLGRPGFGEVVRLEVQLDPTGRRITATRFLAAGCGFLIATAEWTCRQISGLPAAEALSLTTASIATPLALPPAKVHCAALLSKAVAEAVSTALNSSKAGSTK